MQKIKTIRSVSKRFKKTASGKFKRKKSNLQHILTKKTTNYKRNIRSKSLVSKNDSSKIKLCLPYV